MPEPEFTSDYDEMFKETISKPDNQADFSAPLVWVAF